MRALRVVGITEDGAVVLEDSGRRERYTVAADEQLRAAARGDLTRLGQSAIELESQLRPREIQARIRAGASVEQVATAAGVPPQKIERFAYPVLLERSRTAEVAQRAHPMRSDGPDARMLGDVIAHTFGLRGQEYAEAEWDSWKGEDGKWVVALSWRAGRSDNRAHWTFHPGAHGGTVTALDEHASDLVEGLPARPLRTVGPVIDIARPEEPVPPGPPEELRAAASDSARGNERLDAMRSAAGMRVDAGRDRPSARPAEQRVGAPPQQRQPEPRRDSRPPDTRSADADYRSTESRSAESGAAESRSTAESRTAAAAPPDTRATPSRTGTPGPSGTPGPAGPADVGFGAADTRTTAPRTDPPREPAAEQPADAGRDPEPDDATTPAPDAAPRRTRKGKPVMPSWDEVLLGVRGQR
jgi:hypothetical protein